MEKSCRIIKAASHRIIFLAVSTETFLEGYVHLGEKYLSVRFILYAYLFHHAILNNLFKQMILPEQGGS